MSSSCCFWKSPRIELSRSPTALHTVSVASEEIPSSPVKRRFRWQRWIVGAVVVLLFLVIAVALTARYYGYDIAKNWVESPSGARVAGKELGKAIKVDGKFAPLHLEHWTIQTDSFTSTGWPGEAIGSLDAYNVRAEFDPSAIWHRAWRFSNIQIDHAVIRLLKPEDALKRPPLPKKPKPWYALFLPDHFECGPIISQKSDIEFAFQGVNAGIHDAHVQADLIGKDLKYTATSGVLDFPYLPPLRVERLEMLVTRPAITVYTAQMAGIDPQDPARVTLSGRIGMREDKSIDAKVDLVEMPITKILPENLQPLLHGNVSGKLTWQRNFAGDQVDSEGDLKLTGAGINKLSVFKELTVLDNNPDLQDFNFDEAACHYHLHDGQLSLELHAKSTGRFNLTGKIVYDLKSKMADLDLSFDELPLKTWLPPEFKTRYSGVASARMKWHGQLDIIKDSTASISINLDGAHIMDPVLLRQIMEAKGFRTPDELQFERARFDFDYRDEIFRLIKADLVSSEGFRAQMTGQLNSDKALIATLDWQGLVLDQWLPAKVANQLSGILNGHATLAVRKWKFGEGSYGGDIHLLDGELQYTSVQSLMARFLNQRSLLTLPLTQLQLSWIWNNGNLNVSGIDIRAGDDVGIKGAVDIDNSKKLSGLVWIGTKPEYLQWLPDAEKTVFVRNEDELVWAKVKISGTTKKPGQDLSTQIVRQLTRHPLAMVGLGFKVISWYVGDWFGAAKDWKRPPVASVEVPSSSRR